MHSPRRPRFSLAQIMIVVAISALGFAWLPGATAVGLIVGLLVWWLWGFYADAVFPTQPTTITARCPTCGRLSLEYREATLRQTSFFRCRVCGSWYKRRFARRWEEASGSEFDEANRPDEAAWL